MTHTVEVPEVGPQRKKVYYVGDVREEERESYRDLIERKRKREVEKTR